MKREGRQHGLVRTSPDPVNRRPESRLHKLASPPTAGSFSKVSSKPTNHSKPSGKLVPDPVSRSKDKIKGTHKLRSADVVLNWRVVAAGDYILDDDDDD